MARSNRSRRNELPQDLDHAVDKLVQSAEDFGDWLEAGSLGFGERYASGKSCLHVHVRLWIYAGRQPQVTDLCAYYQLAQTDPLDRARTEVEGRSPNAPSPMKLGTSKSLTENEQKSVFVGVVEIGEDSQGVPVSVLPSLIRLQPLDVCERVNMHPTGHPDLNGLLEPFAARPNPLVLNDREGGVVIWRPSISEHQLMRQMVKRRSEVVNEIANEKLHGDGDGVSATDHGGNVEHSAIAELGVRLGDDFIRVRVPEVRFGYFEGLEVFLCSVELGERAAQITRQGGT